MGYIGLQKVMNVGKMSILAFEIRRAKSLL